MTMMRMTGLMSSLFSYLLNPTNDSATLDFGEERKNNNDKNGDVIATYVSNNDKFLVHRHSPPTLGAGSFADVVVGKRLVACPGGKSTTEHAIAVKRISKTRGGIPVPSAYPLEEARLLLLARSHPNIVNLLGVNLVDDPDRFLLFFELVPKAVDLFEFVSSHVLESGYSLAERTAVDIGQQMTSALAHCHSLDISHRDVKLENALRCPETGHVVLIDFGLSTSISSDPCIDRTLCGSKGYAAPELGFDSVLSGAKRRRFLVSDSDTTASERRRKIEIFKATDSWSFGVTFFSILFGFALFPNAAIRGDVVFEILKRVEAKKTEVGMGLVSFLEELFKTHYKKPCIPASSPTVHIVNSCVRLEASRRLSMQEVNDKLSTSFPCLGYCNMLY
tara:strand:+ start:3145 stop:4317 length:1173 start_codon:yes stop_codon:yes gene_type:complete